MIFKTPWILFLIPLLVLFILWLKKKQRSATLLFPDLKLVSSVGKTWKTRFAQGPFYLRLLIISLFIVALAGPRSVLQESEVKTEGVDIVLALDDSGSMAAEDFTLNGKRYNRVAVIKDVVKDFIDGRHNDRIGLVVFAGRAYTASPLTTDYTWLKENLKRIELGMLEDGTAIGSAISSALSRLQKSPAKSKVIILLTDGINNAGKIDPLSAARAAKALGIKIYTVGAGTRGLAPFPVQDVWGHQFYQDVKIDIDEDTLKQIADITGGKYFRATDTDTLRQIYQEIDRLEKSEIKQLNYREYKELFVYFLGWGLALLMLELILTNTIFLRVP